jgi:hypothetical protein
MFSIPHNKTAKCMAGNGMRRLKFWDVEYFYSKSSDDQRPMTVGVEEEEGRSPLLDFSPLNMVARATQQATWNMKPQK